MGFLDSKERIFDVVLTDRGRQLLAENKLKFSYYAFSDEGINYSGSLSASTVQSQSVDDYVFRNLSFEADQRKNGLSLPENNDLKSFLFTIPSKNKTLPSFEVSIEEDEQVRLRRRFFIDTLILHTRKRNRIKQPIAIVARATVPKETLLRRMQSYILEQRKEQVKKRLEEEKNITGLPIRKNVVALTNRLALNINTGGAEIIDENTFSEETDELDALSVKKEIEVVAGLDSVNIDLKLQDFEGEIQPRDGFLVEVFLSGADGLLTKINRDEVVRFVDDKTEEDGFKSFLDLREE